MASMAAGESLTPFDQHDLQADLAAELVAEADEALDDPAVVERGVGPVDAAEEGGRHGVEGGHDDVGREEVAPDVLAREERPVGQDGDGDGGHLLDLAYQEADVAAEGRFAGAGEGDDVDPLPAREGRPDLGQDVLRREPGTPPHGRLSGRAELAIGAVEGAGLEGDDVDPQREAEAPRSHRAVDELVAGHQASSL